MNMKRYERFNPQENPMVFGKVRKAVQPNAEIGAYAGQGDLINTDDMDYMLPESLKALIDWLNWMDQGCPQLPEDQQAPAYFDAWYTYPLQFGIAANTAINLTDKIQIQQNSEFYITQLQYTFFADNALVTTFNNRLVPSGLTVTLQDQGSNANLINIPAPLVGLFGDGLLPAYLPEPKRLASTSTFQVTISSNGVDLTADDSQLYLFFSGFKRFYYGKDGALQE